MSTVARRSGSSSRSARGRRNSSRGNSIGRSGSYSVRARLVAVFVVLAVILGGGGSPNPLTEILLDIAFAVIALAWVWLSPGAGKPSGGLGDRLALVVIAITLVIPMIQLIPLPPSIWTALPGRGNELDALSLIAEQSSWRPISLSPSRTLASLLAIIPAVFCLYAVARLDLKERRLVLLAIVVMAVVSAWLGAVQITAKGRGFNLYPQFSVGWVTGFQANRNATADVLLIGILALAAVAAPYLSGGSNRLPMGLTRRAFSIFMGGVALFLLAATALTGSRAGAALIAVACVGSVLIIAVSRSGAGDGGRVSRMTLLILIAAVLLGCVGGLVSLSENAVMGRVAEHFSDLGSERGQIWQDSWFALKQYWPVGFGMGGFEPAMLPAERLEYLNPFVPNRAHNDFLEIGIEAGLLGYAMVAAAVVSVGALALRAWREPEMRDQVVFGVTVLILIAFHSVLDYPLRSMSLACLSGVAGGLLVRTREPKRRTKEFRRAEETRGLA